MYIIKKKNVCVRAYIYKHIPMKIYIITFKMAAV